MPLLVLGGGGARWFTRRRPCTGGSSAGLAAGLRFRPARDVLAWHRERGAPELAAGFDPTREAELVDRYAPGAAPTG